MKKNLIAIVLVFCFQAAFSQLTAAKYSILNIKTNTKHSDYGTSFFGPNRILFASSKIDGKSLRNKLRDQKYDLPRYDLFKGFVNLSGEITYVKKLENDFFTKYNESNVSFTPDLRYVYFTQNSHKAKQKANDKYYNLKIYRARVQTNGEWSNVVSLPFNNDNYSCAHPSVSEDGRILFFTSDMPGSNGQSDIYWVLISEDETYGEPQNIGSHVNSSAKENFPYVNGDILYFSSNRPGGNGGLDIYMIALDQLDSKPVNLGNKINSPYDDFCFVLDRKNKTGFFSSNRPEGKGKDDIYFFTQDTEIQECKQIISGELRDKDTDEIISDARVSIYSHENIHLATLPVDGIGKFRFELACRANYKVEARKLKYKKTSQDIGFTPKIFNQNVTLYLEKIPDIEPIAEQKPHSKPIKVTPTIKKKKEVVQEEPLDIAQPITNKDGEEILDLNPIYFELDEYYITQESYETLAKAARILFDYPDIVIEFGSHTDSRASKSYNLHLSSLRAQEVVKHLVYLGVPEYRIKGKGYGETNLVNRCKDDVKCTEKEHLQNRRTQFVILRK